MSPSGRFLIAYPAEYDPNLLLAAGVPYACSLQQRASLVDCAVG